MKDQRLLYREMCDAEIEKVLETSLANKLYGLTLEEIEVVENNG